MSIEKSSGAGVAKVAGHGGHHGVKGRQSASTTGDAAAGSPFALMLTALDGEATALQDGLPAALDALGAGTSVPAVIDPALALAQESAGGFPANLDKGELDKGEPAKGRAATGVKGLADVSGRADAAGDAVLMSDTAISAKRQADALVRDGKAEPSLGTGSTTLGGSSSARSASGQDAKNGKDPHGTGDGAWGLSTAQLATVAAAVDSRVADGDRAAFKSGANFSTTSTEGAWGASGLFRDAQAGIADSGGVTKSEAAAPTPDQFVAEQVNYWVSQNVQSAQLKLDGLGADKVEVNISMNGNEAQVDFRTDQAETRHMLEGAVSQLKDMLSLEGVVLSGVSVGTSSSQQGEQQRQARQQATLRQGKAEVLVPVADVATVKTSRGAGRALDLFV